MLKDSGRNLYLFLGFLALAGICSLVDSYAAYSDPAGQHILITTLTFSLIFAIYTGLILFWMQSVRTRLLPSKTRTYMISAAALMLLHLCLRVFKYRITGSALLKRYTWYAYYVPTALIPALFLLAAISIRRGGHKGRWDERLLLLPAIVLAVVFLTNDLHHLVFRSHPGIMDFTGNAGTYSYGLVFYLMYAWIILAVLSGIILLIRETGIGRNMRKTVPPLAVVLLWVLLISGLEMLHARNIPYIPYQMPEIHIFCMLGIFETCIRGRLIPYNENYTGFFQKLRLPVLITDRNFQPIYASAGTLTAKKEELAASLKAPVYLTEDQKLSGRAIRGGYAFWIADESEVHQANAALEEANDLLASENILIEYENRQKEEDAYLKSRHHIYHEIAGEMYSYQKRIEELLGDMQPERKDFREKAAYISVLEAYVKRKTNLLLLASESESVDPRELVLAISESARYLTYTGLNTSVDDTDAAGTASKTLSLIVLYDAFERIAEQLIGQATLLMVSFRDGGLRLATDVKIVPDFSDIALPVDAEQGEEILFLSLHAPETGEKGGNPS